jgi:hypothetical protein
MAAQVGWGAASIFTALAAAHAAEEVAAELRSVKAVTIARLRRLAGERIGPLLLLAALAASGVLVDDFWLWLALGITTADLVQHARRSLRVTGYTPAPPPVRCSPSMSWPLPAAGCRVPPGATHPRGARW